jgi:hypothetical protein
MLRIPRTSALRAVGAAVAVLLALAAPAAGAAAAGPSPVDPGVALQAKGTSEARAALQAVRDALAPHEQGIDDLGTRRLQDARTDVTHLLMELHSARVALSGEERREADSYFYRPTDGANDNSGFTYEVPEATPVDTAHFRIHYVTSGAQASDPAYVDQVAQVFEEVYANEVDQQGWLPPASDGELGGNGLIDVYLSELGEAGAYGFAAPDDDNTCAPDACDSFHGFMVMDNNYDGYPPDPTGALQATTAHEFNHLSHFATSFTAEPWFYEATAVWQELVNYPAVDARSFYVDSMAALPELPITDFVRETGGFSRSYGLYVWSLWLADAFGPEVIIDTWNQAAAADGHSLDGYDAALRARGSSFSQQFIAFAAATAAWDHGDFPQDPLGTVYPDVRRDEPLASGGTRNVTLDHTAYSLIPLPDTDGTQVTVTAPTGVAAGAAVVVDRGPGQVSVVEADLSSGSATLTVSTTPGAEVTLAVVNADPTLAEPKDDTDGRTPLSYLADGAVFGVGVDTAAPQPGPGPGPNPDPPGPAPGLPQDGGRLDGGGRDVPIGQAIATSQALFADGDATRVVVATSDRFPDALAGAALTGGRGPILYTSGLGSSGKVSRIGAPSLVASAPPVTASAKSFERATNARSGASGFSSQIVWAASAAVSSRAAPA